MSASRPGAEAIAAPAPGSAIPRQSPPCRCATARPRLSRDFPVLVAPKPSAALGRRSIFLPRSSGGGGPRSGGGACFTLLDRPLLQHPQRPHLLLEPRPHRLHVARLRQDFARPPVAVAAVGFEDRQ